MEAHNIVVGLAVLWLVIGICLKIWRSIDAGDTANSLNNTLAKAAPAAKKEIMLTSLASIAIWAITIYVDVLYGPLIVATGEEGIALAAVFELCLLAYVPFSFVRWAFGKSAYPRVQLFRASFLLTGFDLVVLLFVV